MWHGMLHVMEPRRLLIVAGQEGSGKSTIVRALLAHTARGAQIDAEDVGQVNPWSYDDAFRALHLRNVAALAVNFWQAGYPTVLAASIVSNVDDLRALLALLPRPVDVHVLQLVADKATRNQRRIARAKPTNSRDRDAVDEADPEDHSLRDDAGADLSFTRVDNSRLDVEQTVAAIIRALPEVFPS